MARRPARGGMITEKSKGLRGFNSEVGMRKWEMKECEKVISAEDKGQRIKVLVPKYISLIITVFFCFNLLPFSFNLLPD
jgi:hypothetical protein